MTASAYAHLRGSNVQSPGKKVSGIKRHIAVDTQGLPHAIHVTTANVTDRAGALAMFDRRRANLSQVQNVLVDGGYTGKPFATAVQSLLGASVEVVKRNELHTFVVLPKRSSGGAVFRLADPPPLEELREKAQYQPANGGSRLRGANPEEIVNRLLEMQTQWTVLFDAVDMTAKFADLDDGQRYLDWYRGNFKEEGNQEYPQVPRWLENLGPVIARANTVEIVRLLLEYGADAMARDGAGQLPLQAYLQLPKYGNNNERIRTYNPETVRLLLAYSEGLEPDGDDAFG